MRKLAAIFLLSSVLLLNVSAPQYVFAKETKTKEGKVGKLKPVKKLKHKKHKHKAKKKKVVTADVVADKTAKD